MIIKSFPDRIVNISVDDMWQAMKDPKSSKCDHLKNAVTLGRQGKHAKAFKNLNEYHRINLAGLWDDFKAELLETKCPDPKSPGFKNTMKYYLNCWHKIKVQFDPKNIDWMSPDLSGCESGFHYFGWFRTVLVAYVHTGKKEYADWMKNVITQYAEAQTGKKWNDRYKLVVFNQLGASHKTEYFLPAYLALVNGGDIDMRTSRAVMRQCLGFGRALKVQNKEFHAHNISTHGCRCLLTLGRTFPEFKEAASWDKLGTSRIYEQIKRGFYKDGFHDERVWGYGSYTLTSLRKAYEFSQRFGGMGKYDKPMLKGLRNAYQFFAKSVGPAPHYYGPTYGDAGLDTFKNILEDGQRVFPKGTDINLKIDRSKSYLFKPSGFAVLRNGEDPDSTYINTSFGPFAGWHSHQDMLSMNLWSKGETFLEELCRFGPYNTPLDVVFRGPEAHNLFLMDGMVYDCRNIKSEDHQWYSDDHIDYFSATHWAYHYFVFGRDGINAGSPNVELRIRRTILFVKDPGYTIVMDSAVDRFTDKGLNRACTQLWHSPFPFKQTGPKEVQLKKPRSNKGCILHYARPDGLVRLDSGCDFTEEEGARFGASYDRYNVRAKRWMDLDYTGAAGFATLILPYQGKTPKVSLTAKKTDIDSMWRAEELTVKTPSGTDQITLNPECRDSFNNGDMFKAILKRKGRSKTVRG